VRVLFLDLDNLQNNFYNYARYGRLGGLESYVMLPKDSQMIPEHKPKWSGAEKQDPEWVIRVSAPRGPLRAPLSYLRRDSELRRQIRRFDVLVCSGLGLLFARSTGRPFVFISFGSDLDQLALQGWSGNPSEYARAGWARRLGYRLRGRRYRKALPHASCAIVAPHQAARARAMGLKDLRWMNHVLDLEVFHPLSEEEKRTERNILKARFGGDRFVLVGSRHTWRDRGLTDYKGTDIALRALARIAGALPDLRIILIEKGWDVGETRMLVRELDLQDIVCWIAPMPRPDLARLYGSVDAVLDQFGFGILALVAVEAMASGAAVLTKLPSFEAAPFYGETPLFADAGSEDEVAQRLTEILTQPDERDRLGAAGAAWAKRNCRWEVGIGQLSDILSDLVQRQKA